MGAYNLLKTEIQCIHCKERFLGKIQFKFGDTWLNEYLINETIKWGGADIGQPGLDKVKVYGILEEGQCQFCKLQLADEFDIIIEKDIIKSINPLANLEEYNTGDGDFSLLNPANEKPI